LPRVKTGSQTLRGTESQRNRKNSKSNLFYKVCVAKLEDEAVAVSRGGLEKKKKKGGRSARPVTLFIRENLDVTRASVSQSIGPEAQGGKGKTREKGGGTFGGVNLFDARGGRRKVLNYVPSRGGQKSWGKEAEFGADCGELQGPKKQRLGPPEGGEGMGARSHASENRVPRS